MIRSHRTSSRGFTLLELVLVMVLIATAMAVAAPSMSGWGRGSKMRDASDEVLAVARWGRAHAVSSTQVHRLYVDASTGRYWLNVMDGQQFVPLGTEFGRIFTVPSGFRLAMVDEQQAPLEYVDFQPTGRATPVRIRLAAGNDVADIICPSPAEDFRYATAQEQQVLR